jgi:hypothetical protein
VELEPVVPDKVVPDPPAPVTITPSENNSMREPERTMATCDHRLTSVELTIALAAQLDPLEVYSVNPAPVLLKARRILAPFMLRIGLADPIPGSVHIQKSIVKSPVNRKSEDAGTVRD